MKLRWFEARLLHIAPSLCKQTLSLAEYIIEIMSQMLQKLKNALFQHVYLLDFILLLTA